MVAGRRVARTADAIADLAGLPLQLIDDRRLNIGRVDCRERFLVAFGGDLDARVCAKIDIRPACGPDQGLIKVGQHSLAVDIVLVDHQLEAL